MDQLLSPKTRGTIDKQGAAENIVKRLKGVIAPNKMMTDALMTYAYSGDASFYRLVPALVVIIDTEAQVQALLQATRDEGLSVTFRAAGTSLSGQAVTDNVLAVLGDGWRKLEIIDGGARINLGPSIIVANANKALRPYHRKIGPDPASQATCKIGGVVANNSSGMCCGVAQNTYYTMDRLRLILADGTVLDTGSPDSRETFARQRPHLLAELHALHHEVVADPDLVALIARKYAIKNTVGYSLNALVDFHDPIDILTHLLVGSEGTLGFVSEVTYNTVPDHPFKATALVPFPDAYSCARGIMKSEKTGVSAAEYIERRALATVEHEPAMAALVPLLTENSPAVLIEVMADSAEALRDTVARATAALMSEGPLSIPDFTTDPDLQNALWDIRRGFFTTAGAARPAGTSMMTEDVAAPIDRLADFVLDLRALLDNHGYEDAVIFGHALAGNLHFQMAANFGDPDETLRFDRFSIDLADLVSTQYGGSLKAEHGTGRAIAAYVEAEWGTKAYGLMQRIKQLFDPENLLNPGVLINSDPHIHLKNLKTMPLADPLVDLCIECGFCEPACPSQQMTLSPRQRIAVTRERERLRRTGEDNARLKRLDDDFVYAGLDTCAACNLCSLRCPVGIETGTMIIGQRAERRGGLGHAVAKASAGQLGLIERAMSGGVGLAGLAKAVIGGPAIEAITETARRATGKRIPRISRALDRGPGGPKVATSEAAPLGKVIYFPSCATRMFGTPPSAHDLLLAPQAMLELLRRVGFDPVVPEHLTGQCCGQPFSSKGFPEQADEIGAKLVGALSALSGDGALPVLTDASTCAKHLRGLSGPMTVADSPEFLIEHILPRLAIVAPLPVLAVHHNCSAQRLKEQGAIEKLASACATRIAVLSSVTCCGYAGDKGLFVPELNAHATRFVKNDIPPDCTLGVSTVSTCASGLSEHAGVPFVSLVSVLELVSRPQ